MLPEVLDAFAGERLRTVRRSKAKRGLKRGEVLVRRLLAGWGTG